MDEFTRRDVRDLTEVAANAASSTPWANSKAWSTWPRTAGGNGTTMRYSVLAGRNVGGSASPLHAHPAPRPTARDPQETRPQGMTQAASDNSLPPGCSRADGTRHLLDLFQTYAKQVEYGVTKPVFAGCRIGDLSTFSAGKPNLCASRF